MGPHFEGDCIVIGITIAGLDVGDDGFGPGSKNGAGSTSMGGSALGTKGISGPTLGPVWGAEGSCWPSCGGAEGSC